MPTLGQHDYPLTTVADGIENAKKIVLQFKGQSFDRKALAAALGNKSAETGAFNQRLGDLRRFGVIAGHGAATKPDSPRLPLEPENPNVIEVRAGEVNLKYPLTKTGLKLMRHNFQGPGFWEILEEQVSKSEAPSGAASEEGKTA